MDAAADAEDKTRAHACRHAASAPPSNCPDRVFAKNVWRVEEFGGAKPAIAEVRAQLALYGGSVYLHSMHHQAKDSNKIIQTTPLAALVDAWNQLFDAAPKPPAMLLRPATGASAGAGGSSQSRVGARAASQSCRRMRKMNERRHMGETISLVSPPSSPESPQVATRCNLFEHCEIFRSAEKQKMRDAVFFGRPAKATDGDIEFVRGAGREATARPERR